LVDDSLTVRENWVVQRHYETLDLEKTQQLCKLLWVSPRRKIDRGYSGVEGETLVEVLVTANLGRRRSKDWPLHKTDGQEQTDNPSRIVKMILRDRKCES
jgi:hypothetical protein